MIARYLTSNEIAQLLATTIRWIQQRAQKENWQYRTCAVRGGQERRYLLLTLPEDVQMAYAVSIKTSFEELQKELKPDDIGFNKKVVITGYNCRSRPAREAKPFAQSCRKGREKAHLRAKLIGAWSASGLSPEAFAAKYSAGEIVPEIRGALGKKELSASTLYRWMQQYTSGGEDGLAPQYVSRRGGNGASLDDRTKSLIWFYYLNKNRPSAANVIRKLKEKDNIEVGRSIAYRYIGTEISEAAKIYYRQGPKAYKDKCVPYIDIDYTKFHSMQWAVYDHKTLDFASRVMRADGWHRARLSLTCAIDKRSRKILGWHIDETPSTLTIIRATRMMVERYGCPEGAQTDNGRDFTGYWFSGDAWNEQHSRLGAKDRRVISSVLEDLGMAISYTTPYHAQSKNIERLFGFMALEFDKSFDSYLGSNTSDRHDQSRLYVGSFEGAPMRPIEELPTIEETRLLFAKFAEWYNSTWKHSGQGMGGKTPDVVFAENLRGRRDIPKEYEKYVWTRREIKTVQQNGVRDGGSWYYNEAMLAIIGQEVELRVSIDDIGAGYIFNLHGEYLYDAASEFKDSGIVEENMAKVRRHRRQANRHLDKYEGAINEVKKDKRTQLEELRDAEAAAMATFELKVVGGEPLPVSARGTNTPNALTLVPPAKPQKKKVRTMFDAE